LQVADRVRRWPGAPGAPRTAIFLLRSMELFVAGRATFKAETALTDDVLGGHRNVSDGAGRGRDIDAGDYLVRCQDVVNVWRGTF
jgi:hypothetical protein